MLMKHYYWSIASRCLLGVLFWLALLLLLVGRSDSERSGRNDDQELVAIVVVGVFLGGVGLVKVGAGVWYLWNPARHRLLGRLARYGNPLEVARQIDAELAANRGVVYLGKRSRAPRHFAWQGLWVTPSWVVQVHPLNVAVVRLADLEWVEEARMPTDQNRRGLVDYEVGLVGGRRAVFRITREETYRLYLVLAERCPWILDLETHRDEQRADRPASRPDRQRIVRADDEESLGQDG
jgi:hypothetical protein